MENGHFQLKIVCYGDPLSWLLPAQTHNSTFMYFFCYMATRNSES